MWRKTENEDQPVRMTFGVHSFCSCFVGESAGYVWQFKIRILNLCDLATEHQSSLLIMLHLISWRVGVALLSDCILFCAVCSESGRKLNRGLATRLQFCVSYDLRKAKFNLINIGACVYVHVCACVCGGRGRSSTSLLALYVILNELLYLSESPEVPFALFLVLAMYGCNSM